jgi:hypothetical protein
MELYNQVQKGKKSDEENPLGTYSYHRKSGRDLLGCDSFPEPLLSNNGP